MFKIDENQLSFFKKKNNMADTDKREAQIPELLYHTLLTVVDWSKDAAGGTRSIFPLGTHGQLDAAKTYAKQSLNKLNFSLDDFEEYAVRPTAGVKAESWSHGEGVMVFARALSGQEFRVGIETTANNENLPCTADGQLSLPLGARFLHYLLQTVVDYNSDRTGALQTTQIEGTYLHRADAWTAAHNCLDKQQYVEYDERGDGEFLQEWPFDDDVAVHAVSDTGENHFVAVKIPPWAKHTRRGSFKQKVLPVESSFISKVETLPVV